MCFIISGVFSYLAFSFYVEGDIVNATINGSIALLFLILLTRNIFKTKKEKNLQSSFFKKSQQPSQRHDDE